MKRQISGMEAEGAGLLYAVGLVAAVTDPSAHPGAPAEMVDGAWAYRIWRSRPGYRKSCRMLRRSGRRVPQAFERRACAKGEATPFRGMDALPGEMGVQAYLSALDDPDAATFAAGSAYALPSYMGIDPASCPVWKSDTRESTAASIIRDIENMRILATKEH